jgi:septal ring factor EnvC (AmiA/AmiB activator)
MSPPPLSGSPSPSPAHARAVSIQARRTSASHYRRPSVNASDLLRSANKSPLSPTDVPDIYFRQLETISTLTTDNEKLAEEVEKLKAKEKRLGEIEAEKDKLQEQLAEVREELRGVKGRIDGAEQGKKTSEEEMEKMVCAPDTW